MFRRRAGIWASLILFALALLPLAGTSAASATPIASPAAMPSASSTASPEQQLVDKFAPIAYLRAQKDPCDRKGEAYYPAPVDVVLNNPAIALKHATTSSSRTDPIVKMGPTAQDLAGLDSSYYLDFPGNPHRAGCAYATNFRQYAAQIDAKPTTYARIVIDEARGKLVVQYWFWYYFNDWNNTHESDWEMIQLVFDATSVEQALTQTPSVVGYAQHGGGETASWDDAKFGKDGDHPLIHPGAGSHATYFGYASYIGWGEGGTGFGCDNTYTPATAVPLTVVLLPDNPDPTGPFAWLSFDGRWGEKQPSEWSGPVGMNKGGKWRDPLGAMSNWRDVSLTVPSSKAIGPNATDIFCTLSTSGSRAVTALVSQPKLLIGVFLTIILAVAALFFIKRKQLGEAFGFYRRHVRLLFAIGLFSIPIGVVFNELQFLARDYPPGSWLMEWFNDTLGARFAAATAVGGIQQVAMLLLIAPPIIQAMKDIEAGESPSVIDCFRRAYVRLGRLMTALLALTIAIGALGFAVIGLPVAIWLAVRWQFFGQAVILDDAPTGITALVVSGQAVRGRWWRSLGNSLVFQLFTFLPGPLVGAVLMLLGKTTVEFANAFSSVVYALTVPISVIGLTFAYRRLRGERPAPARPSGASAIPGPAPASAG